MKATAIRFGIFDIFDRTKVMSTALKILCMVLIVVIACRLQQHKCEEYYGAEIERITAAHEAELNELTVKAENGLYTSVALADDYTSDAEALARLIQGTIPNHSAEAKAALCWLVFNRTEDAIFPDSIIDVIKQPGQFDTYSADTPVTAENYALAHNELTKYLTGDYRLISPGYVYMTCGSDIITLRDAWEVDSAHAMQVG